jgi:hypothetical protein
MLMDDQDVSYPRLGSYIQDARHILPMYMSWLRMLLYFLIIQATQDILDIVQTVTFVKY